MPDHRRPPAPDPSNAPPEGEVPDFTLGSPRVCLDRVDWLRVAPVLQLLRAPALALQPGKLAVAYAMLLALTVWGLLLDGVWRLAGGGKPFAIVIADTAAALGRLSSAVLGWLRLSPAEVGLFDAAYAVLLLPVGWWADGESGLTGMRLFVLVFGFGALIIKALGFSMLSLLAGSEATRGEPIGLKAAWRGALVHAPRLLIAWLSLVAAALLLLVPGLIAGLLLRVAVLEWIAALVYGLLLLGGIGAAALLAVHLLAAHLMPLAIAIDDDDLFDAVSRSVNYSAMRPIKYLGCQIICGGVLALTMAVVFGLVAAGQNALLMVLELAGGAHAQDAALGGHGLLFLRESLAQAEDRVVVTLVALATTLVMIGAWAVLASTYSCAQTRIYLILRRSADGAATNEAHGPAAPGSPLK